jgi:hypothetical protein
MPLSRLNNIFLATCDEDNWSLLFEVRAPVLILSVAGVLYKHQWTGEKSEYLNSY